MLTLRKTARLVEERTVVERRARALRGVLEPPADDLRALDQSDDLGQLALGHLAKALDRRLVGLGRIQQQPDLVEAEAGALGSVDDGQRPDDLRAVAAPAAEADGRVDEADLLVVAKR